MDDENFSSIENSSFECNSFDEISSDLENNSEDYNFDCENIYESNSPNRINLNIQNEMSQSQLKYCPICNEKFSIISKTGQYECLKCGYKTLPLTTYNNPITEKKFDYNENLTAEDVLNEWGNEVKKVNSCQRKHYPSETRCKCENNLNKNKLCAYCRIKINCQELFNNISKNIDNELKFLCQNKLDNKTNQKNQTKIKNSTTMICKDILNDKQKKLLKTQSELEELRKTYGLSGKIKLHKTNKRKIKNFSKKLNNENIMYTIFEKDKPKCSNFKKYMSSPSSRDNIKRRAKRLRRKLRRRKRRNFYVPTSSPRINNTRHRNCISEVRVPNNMGWLWTVFTKENGKWRPGYIPKKIRELMLHFIRPIDVLPLNNAFNNLEKCGSHTTPKIPVQKPTLHIKRINGDYIITMQPLKDPKSLCESVDPYLDMEPIRFKISRRPITVKRHEIKKILKEKGFEICKCQKPISKCNCRTFIEKQRLEKEVQYLCRNAGIKDLRDELHFSDVTDNEGDLDIDFTPPVGIVKCALIKKPDAVVKETQYDPSDFSKPEPFESPFKISHPNHKESVTLKKFVSKRDDGKEPTKSKKKIKSSIDINDTNNSKIEQKKSVRGGMTGKNTKTTKENINKNAKKIGSKSKSNDQVSDRPKSGKSINTKRIISVEIRKKDNIKENIDYVNVDNLESKFIKKNDNASGDKLKRKESAYKKDEYRKLIGNILSDKEKNQRIGDTNSIRKFKRRKIDERKLSNPNFADNNYKTKTEMGYISTATEESGSPKRKKGISSPTKLTLKGKEKGWNSTVRISIKPKLKPVSSRVPEAAGDYDVCNNYCNQENLICHRLPEFIPTCNDANEYNESYPVTCAQDVFNNYVKECGRLYG